MTTTTDNRKTPPTSQTKLSAPAFEKIDFRITPAQAARKLAHLPGCLLLESSMQENKLGRYSFLMADPVEFKTWPAPDVACLDWLSDCLSQNPVEPIRELPPFQGGVAGLWSYDFHRAIEAVPLHQFPGVEVPTVALGVYDTVIAWDHYRNQSWICSQGYPEQSPSARMTRANERMAQFKNWLKAKSGQPLLLDVSPSRIPGELQLPITTGIAHRFPQLASNFSRKDYLAAIEQALAYIRAGDIFQVNVAQQLTHPAIDHAWSLYERLRLRNPSTFAAYFDMGSTQLISASPERLASVRDRVIESRPIKGTRRRTRYPDVDLFMASELRQSDKDRAENVMIVDLMRNDLSRICHDDSVRVTQLLKLETYASVLHLVSAIEGILRIDVTAADLIRAIFPGGSVTGAPKIRAMEIIAELEPSARGAYCGSLGYFGFDGSVDLNILIRTITASGGIWNFPVGGGIVADSQPDREYQETWTKAAAMLESLMPAKNQT